MKKIILSATSAILSLAGFSSFKTVNNTATTYYWFIIATDKSTPVNRFILSIPSAYVTFQLKATVVPSTSALCNKTNTYHCLIGFTAGQVAASGDSYVLRNPTTIPITQPTGSGNLQYVRSTQ